MYRKVEMRGKLPLVASPLILTAFLGVSSHGGLSCSLEIDLSAEHPGDISISKMCFMHLFVCIWEFLLVFLIAERVLLRGRTSHLLVYVPKILHNGEMFAHAVLQSGICNLSGNVCLFQIMLLINILVIRCSTVCFLNVLLSLYMFLWPLS